MSDINKDNVLRSIAYGGSVGNATTQVSDGNMPQAAVGDVIYLQKIASGTYLKGFKLQSVAAISAAGGTLDIGYKMGATTVVDYFAADAAADAVLNVSSASMPIKVTEELYIIATVKVAAVNTGDIRVAMQTNINFIGEI